MVIFLHFIKQLEPRTTVCVQTVEPQAGSRPAALIAFLTDNIYLFIILRRVEYMSHFSYACKTEEENGISRLISKTA